MTEPKDAPAGMAGTGMGPEERAGGALLLELPVPEPHRRYDLRNHHFAGESGILIPALQRAQEAEGHVSRAAMLEIHRRSGIPLAHIFGVVTFYAQFRLHPVGRHLIRVCHGTACHVSGANAVSKAMRDHLKVGDGETTPDRLYTLETVACLGCCSLAPVVMVGGSTFARVKPAEVRKVLREFQASAGKPGEP